MTFNSKWCASLVFIAAIGGFANMTMAHPISLGDAYIQIDGRQSVLEVGVPVSAFQGVDDNSDGLLQPSEIELHVLEMLSQLNNMFTLDLHSTEGTITKNDITTNSYVDAQQSVKEVQWLRITDYTKSIPTDGVISLSIDRSRIKQDYNIKIERDKKVDSALMSSGDSEHTFFQNGWKQFGSYLKYGLEHILGGPDHIVFLVVLLIEKVCWRRWAALLATFTLAHGITYGLATLDIVKAPVNIVEQMIALSIVVMSLKRLFKVKIHLRWDLSLVFVFGLVHGLGFASAMAGGSRASSFPIISILAFNIGIELGQNVIAAVLLLILWLAKRLHIFDSESENFRWAALLPAVIGLYWLLQRI